MAETHSDSGHIIPAPGAEARQCGGLRHFRRTPSAPGFPKEQLKLSSGGVAIITFCNETFRDDSGNPIAINPCKGAHTVAATLTESGMIRIYNPDNHALKPIEICYWEKYVNTGGFICGYYIEK